MRLPLRFLNLKLQ
ncbi:unnamed protein product [Linum tenue]|uniref:Uncharacterized protein n=1 Tax=Linum tenue TaxID=586396 RepID=A0AAV0PUU6_9ROSI|nr:unnamed protein product [Linum tenue]